MSVYLLRGKLAWYWYRLYCMSFSEVSYRCYKSLLTLLQRIGLFTARTVPNANFSCRHKTWSLPIEKIDEMRYIRAAEAILQGRIEIFALKNANLGPLPNWNRDPSSGVKVPLLFGKTIDYREPTVVGNIKYIWEVNRHLQLVTLAQAYHLTKNQRYLLGIASQIRSWIEQCPYLRGPNWTSSLELAIRLINWSFAWQWVGGLESPLFREVGGRAFLNLWVESIYQHAHFIRNNLSRFSSANNHLIGEATGLFVAAMTWPFWPESTKWKSAARKEILRETLLQNCRDGVNREQAISYQQFVLDFLIIAGLIARTNADDLPDEYWRRIEVMLEYLASIMDVGGNVPRIGDSDDGYVVRLSQEHDFCPYRSLLATGAVLFQRGDFKKKSERLDDKTRWLLGKQVDESYSKVGGQFQQLPVRRAFPEGGYYVLGCDFETKREIRLIVDAGPLGYQSIAAHGHADALAFTLSVGGREFLIDPGTYAYHTHREWRDYFRGTSAHNTVVIDGQNQSIIGGAFLWTEKATVTRELWDPADDTDRLVARHDGYKQLRDPVVHRRDIRLLKRERKVVVKDTLECASVHFIQCYWHFSERCDVVFDGDAVIATNGASTIRLLMPDQPTKFELARGQEYPPLGWVSRKFDVKLATTTATASYQIDGTYTLTTELVCT